VIRRGIAVAAAILAVLVLGLYVAAQQLLASDAVRSAIAGQLSARFGQPVRIASAGAWIFPRVGVDLRDVTIGDPASVHLAHVRVATGLRALLSRTIAEAEVEITDGRVALPLPFPLAAAPAPVADQPSSPSLTIASIRHISLRNVAVVAGGRTLHVDLESALDGDRLDISALSARADKTHIDANGTLTSIARLEGRFEAGADPLDLDEMIAIASAMTASGEGAAAQRRPTESTLHLTMAMKAPSGQFGGYAFRDLSSTIDLAAGRFTLSPLSLRTFGGSLTGVVTVNTSGAVPRVRFDGGMDNLDMTEIMKISGSPGAITGRLGGTIDATADGTDGASVMRTARGTIHASIADGQLPRLDIVRNVVLAFGKPSGAAPEGSGTAFARIGGTFSLANGVLTTDDLTLTSRDVEMRGGGSVRLASGGLQARAEVRLSRELTEQAGSDLRRYAQEDGRVIVPATIGGSLARPVVSVDVAAAGRRALENELRRRAKDWLGGLIKRKGGG
jgi:uncharacterized protein involved in outer membrane biogenesis